MIRAVAIVLIAIFGWGCRSDFIPHGPVTAEAKAIEFLQREVPAWSRENGCFSCHNNGDGARALYGARRIGYRVAPQALADTTDWVTRPGQWEHNKGDPGFSDQRLASIQFAASLLAARDSGQVIDRRSLEEAARKVAADQGDDGAWHVEPHNPVGSPATYGTTLATFMAWRTLVAAGQPQWDNAIKKVEQWLSRVRADNLPNAAVLLLWSARDRREPLSRARARALDFIASAQVQDGGWGPYKDSPPEIFDTALAILALSEIRDEREVPEMIERGRSFLRSHQLPDGSWPATTRPSGGESYAQQISTTAWATLALLRADGTGTTRRDGK
jgi:hypothetical protein